MTRRRVEPVEPVVDEVALACHVPDAVAVTDDAGELVGWDESAAHAYLAEHGMPSACDAAYLARGHVDPF